MKGFLFIFNLLDIHFEFDYDPSMWWIDLLSIEVGDDWCGSLFYIGWVNSRLEFDIFFLRHWYYKRKLGM